jgi:hypothetical protein
MDLEASVLMFWQARNAAAAIFFKKIGEMARFAGKLPDPDHGRKPSRQTVSASRPSGACVFFTAGNADKPFTARSA